MGCRKTLPLAFCMLVLLLSSTGGVQARDSPWLDLSERVANFLNSAADRLEHLGSSRSISSNNLTTLPTTSSSPDVKAVQQQPPRSLSQDPQAVPPSPTAAATGADAAAGGRKNTASPSEDSAALKAPAATGSGAPQPQSPSKQSPSKALRRAQKPIRGNPARLSDAKLQQGSCPSQGQITAVWCREDASGALQDIAYTNSATAGLQVTGCSGQQGSDAYSKVLILDEGESIVSVKSCSLDRDGYASVTFITDGDKQFTCGSSRARNGNGGGGNGGWGNSAALNLQQNNKTPTHEGEDSIRQRQAALVGKLNNTMIQDSSGRSARLAFVDSLSDATSGGAGAGGTTNGDLFDSHNKAGSGDSDAGTETETEHNKGEHENDEGEHGVKAASQGAPSLKGRRRANKRHSSRSRTSRGTPDRYRRQLDDAAQAARAAGVLRGRLSNTAYPARSLLAGEGDTTEKDGPAAVVEADTAAAAEPATWWWFDWGHGDNEEEPESGCQLYTPDRIPEWASASARSKTGEPFHSFEQGGSGADAYLQFGSRRYFKDPATYQQQLAQYRSGQSDRRFFLGWEPAWFWDQVEPLAGLTLACNGGIASQIQSLCWSSSYSPPPAAWGVPSRISLTFEEGFVCPQSPAQIQALQLSLDRFSQQLAAGSGGAISGIAWGRYTPASCLVDGDHRMLQQVQGNVTITLQSTFLPGPFQGLLSVGQWLLFIAPADLCDVTSSGGQSACSNTDIFSVMQIITIVFGEGAPTAGGSASLTKEQQLQALQQLQAKHESAKGLMEQQQQQQQQAVKPAGPKHLASP